MSKLQIFAAGLMLAIVAGCGEPNPLGRKAVFGEIIFDGAPLDSGLIEFSPRDPSGVSTGGSIQNGKYRIEAHQGIPPGEYKVRITSPVERGAAEEDAEPSPPGPDAGGPRQPPPATERIPGDYNMKTKQTVTVTEAGPNQFDFDIPAAKSR